MTTYSIAAMLGVMASRAEQKLIQIVDGGMAEAVRKGGACIACRPGCCECCIGVFPIRQSDAVRLREGLRELAATDMERVRRVSQRARDAVARYGRDFPGNVTTGILGEDADSRERFEDFADDDPCPALDPETRTCDLYQWRPVPCRTFGPALRLNGDSVDICELCYDGASDEEIVSMQVELDIEQVGAVRECEAETETGLTGETIVAFALR